MANDIGFDRFFVQQPYITLAYHWKTGERYYLEPADDTEFDRTRLQDNSTKWSKHFATPEEKEAYKKAVAPGGPGGGWRYGEFKPGYGEQTDEVMTDNNYVKHSNCMHIDLEGDGSYNYSLFLTASGKIMPCCYFDEAGIVLEKDFDMKTLDIKNEFDNNEHRFTCRRKCGSIK